MHSTGAGRILIGSTAVPAILAKPVIGILAIVSDVHALDAQSVETLGYEGMGEFGLPGRRYCRKHDSAGVRTHHVPAYAPGSSSDIERLLNCRDCLSEHPATGQLSRRTFARVTR